MDTQAIPSSNHTHNLHHTFYEPKTEVKATLLIVHGMAEHSGRYVDFANYLSSHGIAVTTYDHLGHGQTINSTDELGFIDQDYPMQTLQKDVIVMADTVKAKYPNVPHYIMGHSMGSFIVRTVLQHHSHCFNGAILMGTGDKDPSIKLLIPLFSVLNKSAAKKPCGWAASILNKVLNSKIKGKKSKSPFEWVSKSIDNRNAYESDPLCGFTFSHNGFLALFSLMDNALNKNWHESLTNDYPLMFVSGQEDPIGNMGKGINKLVNRMQSLGYNNIDKKLYANMRHEPLNEEGYEQVYNDISEWLLAR